MTPVLSASADPSTLDVRAVGLIAMVVLLFAAAGAALKIGQRLQQRRQAQDMSSLTGSERGAHQGGDDSHITSEQWLAETTGGGAATPQQSWQRAFLDEGPPATIPALAEHAQAPHQRGPGLPG